MAVGFPAKTNFATGEVLTATNMNDITGTLNLLQSTLYPAGRNKIINGDFSVNQRSFSSDTAGGYSFDRWQIAISGATCTYTAQTFALGTAPVAGYEGKNFLRLTTTVGNDFCRTAQSIESVRTFAGQTVVLSFWAKGTNPSTLGGLRVRTVQNFGTGGSPSSSVNTAEQNLVLTANWTRYSFTFDIASIAGKTIGTAGDDRLEINMGQITNASTDAWTLDLWGVQLEAASTGSTASPFQTASGSIAGELALCQRYYYRTTADTAYGAVGSPAFATSSTAGSAIFPYAQTMRTTPSSVEYSNLGLVGTGFGAAITSVTLSSYTNKQYCILDLVGTGFVTGTTAYIRGNNNSAAYLAFNAEL